MTSPAKPSSLPAPRPPGRRGARCALLVLALAGLGLAACGGDDGAGTTSTTAAAGGTSAAASDTTTAEHGDHGDHDHAAEGPTVVASTSWVAAIADAAGAGEVTAIAPNSVQHPPDYEPKPSDLAAVAEADFVVLAGFEGFAEQLRTAAGSDAEVIVVEPSYDPAKLEAQIMLLAEAFGTTETAEARAAELVGGIEAVSAALKADVGGRKPVVVAHLFAAEWAGLAGLTPAGTYGPEPISASQTAELAALDPEVVFENSHMAGSGAAVAGASGAKLVALINFPGDDLDLVAVAERNADAIREALEV
ncbi:MAG: metal ABC transporter solute-binding protein, Zn/Mn family [Acidimicrobiia bacterium]